MRVYRGNQDAQQGKRERQMVDKSREEEMLGAPATP